MASVRLSQRGSIEIRFRDAAGKRRSFYPEPKGRTEAARIAAAETIGDVLDRLAFAIGNGQPVPADVLRWLAKLDRRKHAKLVGWGLADPRPADAKPIEVATVGTWTRRFVERGSWKSGTVEQIEIAMGNLRTFFGADRPIADITPGDAEDYRRWLTTAAKAVPEGAPPEGLAHNTYRRRMGRAKECFASAVRHKIIAESPFADEVAATGANVDKHRFIPADWVHRLIDVAPCEDWRVMLAFARFGGMRSHETRIQRWEDVDLKRRRMIVRSNKNPPSRTMPILPDLMPHLLRAREMQSGDGDLIVTRYDAAQNILTTLAKLIDQAGLTPWPDAMQNLRRTRETELMASYPVKDVASWIGNSVPVAMRHYAMAMEDSFTRAIVDGIGGTSGGVVRLAPPETPPDVSISANLDALAESSHSEKPRKNPPRMTGAGCISYPART